MGYNFQVVNPENGGKSWIFTKEKGEYNTYDDLNQMADVVEKLMVDGEDIGKFMAMMVNKLVQLRNIKQAFRDFIMSTMDDKND